ncbi:hypothetical protein Taro_025977, partial [Colocasia esculenta]|nr:hypothetical protein [Colocasia esculenta]
LLIIRILGLGGWIRSEDYKRSPESFASRLVARTANPRFRGREERGERGVQRDEKMSRERGRRAVLLPPQETIDKLEKMANAGNFYEAQQMYKSITARYAAAERYDDTLDILQSGASVQLKNGQVICGAELAVLFVETLVKGKIPCSEETLGRCGGGDLNLAPKGLLKTLHPLVEFDGLGEMVGIESVSFLGARWREELGYDRIRKIYMEFPQISMPQQLGDDDDMQKLSEALVAAKTRVESCSSFLKAAIKWSAEFGPHKYGSPEIHVMLAEYIYSQSPELDMSKVSICFVRGNNPEKFASTLVNFMGKCYPGEDDLAIARAVLMDANKLMDELKRQLQLNQLDLPDSDLMQFIGYLLQTLERDALPLFRILRQKYKPSIDRESLFDELLDEIAEKYFGVRRRGGLQGMFGDIFKMMGGEAMA